MKFCSLLQHRRPHKSRERPTTTWTLAADVPKASFTLTPDHLVSLRSACLANRNRQRPVSALTTPLPPAVLFLSGMETSTHILADPAADPRSSADVMKMGSLVVCRPPVKSVRSQTVRASYTRSTFFRGFPPQASRSRIIAGS